MPAVLCVASTRVIYIFFRLTRALWCGGTWIACSSRVCLLAKLLEEFPTQLTAAFLWLFLTVGWLFGCVESVSQARGLFVILLGLQDGACLVCWLLSAVLVMVGFCWMPWQCRVCMQQG